MRGGGAADIRWQVLVPLGLRRGVLLLRRAEDEEAVRVRLAAPPRAQGPACRPRATGCRSSSSWSCRWRSRCSSGSSSAPTAAPRSCRWRCGTRTAARPRSSCVADLGKSAVVRTVAVNGSQIRAADRRRQGRRRPGHPGRLQPGGGRRQAGAAHDRLDARVQRGGDGGQRGTHARRRAGDGRAGRRRARRAEASGRRGPSGGRAGGGSRRAAQARPVVAADPRDRRPRAPRSSRPARPPTRLRAASSSARRA